MSQKEIEEKETSMLAENINYKPFENTSHSVNDLCRKLPNTKLNMDTQETMEYDNYYSQNRKEMLEFLPNIFTNILEIGCGQGEFGDLVKKTYNTKYTGIELDNDAAKVAQKRLDTVLVGDVFEQLLVLPDNTYDLLICNDIIEHLSAPELLFQAIRVKMKPNSILVCSIPNIRALGNLLHLLINKDFRYTNYGILDKTHLRFYTQKSIIRLLEENDFTILNIKGINPIKTIKTFLPLLFLQVIGHGDIRYHQFGVSAKF